MSALGYSVALFRDSDVALGADVKARLQQNQIDVFEYGEGLHTEQAVFVAADDACVQALLMKAREEKSVHKVNQNCIAKFDGVPYQVVDGDFSAWADSAKMDPKALRLAVGEVAAKNSWFKDQRIGRELAPLVWQIAQGAQDSALARALAQAECWLYA